MTKVWLLTRTKTASDQWEVCDVSTGLTHKHHLALKTPKTKYPDAEIFGPFDSEKLVTLKLKDNPPFGPEKVLTDAAKKGFSPEEIDNLKKALRKREAPYHHLIRSGPRISTASSFSGPPGTR